MPRIFISHSANDEELVEELVDLLQLGVGVQPTDVFCSSLPGMGIPNGADFVAYIKSQVTGPEVVLLIISPAFLNSPFCQNEVGASWARSLLISPLLVPPVDYADVKGVLSGTQMARLPLGSFRTFPFADVHEDVDGADESAGLVKKGVRVRQYGTCVPVRTFDDDFAFVVSLLLAERQSHPALGMREGRTIRRKHFVGTAEVVRWVIQLGFTAPCRGRPLIEVCNETVGVACVGRERKSP